MRNFITVLLSCSGTMSAVILLYMALTPLLAKHYSARGLYIAWLILAVGLIIPFRPHMESAVIQTRVPAETILASPIPEPNAGAEWGSIAVPPVDRESPIPSAPLPPASSGIRWWQFLAAVWLGGMILSLVCRGIKHRRFIKMADRWSEVITGEQTLKLLRGLKAELGITGQIGLYRCPCIGSPMMIGFVNPRILLPETDFAEEELRFVLTHELVHHKRKDLWSKALVLIATAIHWFNPVVYLMARAVNAQCELSCDAAVVQNADAGTRQRYSEVIMGAARRQTRWKAVLSTNFYGGRKGMKHRILSILDTKKKKAGIFAVCFAVVLTMGVGMTYKAATPDITSGAVAGNGKADVRIRLSDRETPPEDCEALSVSNVESRPELEFYIDGDDVAKIEVACGTEYLYAVDWTETQHEKYWNSDYYQPYDEKAQAYVLRPELRNSKKMSFAFDEDFTDYREIWYRWTPENLYEWASEDDYSHILGASLKPTEDMTEEQKLKLAAGDDGSGRTGLGHIQLEGYPEEKTKDRIIVTVTDRQGNMTTKFINVKISNDERNQTVVTAYVEN